MNWVEWAVQRNKKCGIYWKERTKSRWKSTSTLYTPRGWIALGRRWSNLTLPEFEDQDARSFNSKKLPFVRIKIFLSQNSSLTQFVDTTVTCLVDLWKNKPFDSNLTLTHGSLPHHVPPSSSLPCPVLLFFKCSCYFQLDAIPLPAWRLSLPHVYLGALALGGPVPSSFCITILPVWRPKASCSRALDVLYPVFHVYDWCRKLSGVDSKA